jgi:hypothetical protein
MVLADVLGQRVHSAFLALPGLAGAGLTLAGVTGSCGIARRLALAPCNRRAVA